MYLIAPMHPADIKAALQKKGHSSRAIAAHFGICEGPVSQIISGKAKSERVARRIAQVTGLPVSRLWPGSYPRLELAELQKVAA